MLKARLRRRRKKGMKNDRGEKAAEEPSPPGKEIDGRPLPESDHS